MDNILFSIIVPYHNTPQPLFFKCLNSLENLKYANFEVIIVNNSTEEKFSEVLNKYKNLVNYNIITTSIIGVSHARNLGINAAHGDYILFLDSDDFLFENTCSCFCEIINNNNYPDIVIGKCLLHNNGKAKENKSTAKEGIVEDRQKLIDSLFVNYKNLYTKVEVPWAKAYKRNFLIKEKIYFNELLSNGEDVVFNYEAYHLAPKIYYTKAVVYNYQFNKSSVCGSFCKNLDLKFEKLAVILRDKMIKYNISDFEKLYFFNIRNICRLLKKYYNVFSDYKIFRKSFLNCISKKIFINSIRRVKFKALNIGKRYVVALCRAKAFFPLFLMSKIGFAIK